MTMYMCKCCICVYAVSSRHILLYILIIRMCMYTLLYYIVHTLFSCLPSARPVSRWCSVPYSVSYRTRYAVYTVYGVYLSCSDEYTILYLIVFRLHHSYCVFHYTILLCIHIHILIYTHTHSLIHLNPSCIGGRDGRYRYTRRIPQFRLRRRRLTYTTHRITTPPPS